MSFVNPHDIAWWYKWSDRVPAEVDAARVVTSLPPNFETPELLVERHKPRLQRSFQETAAASFGAVPFSGPEATETWLGFLDLYVALQLEVDRHIGQVMRILESRPEVAANTVIVFTSDHGEYGASHGLRGKGASAYEEGLRVPLLVKDLRGKLTSAPETTRTQLTSSVDVAPLLLTIATGSDQWRQDPHYSHIAGRLDLAGILAEPRNAGPAVHPARHRRDRHRVRDRTLCRRRAAAHRRDAHAAGQVRDVLELALRRDRPALGRAGSRAVRLHAPRAGAWSCTTAPARAPSKKPSAANTSSRSNRSCADRCRRASSARTRAASPITSPPQGTPPSPPRCGANGAANAKPAASHRKCPNRCCRRARRSGPGSEPKNTRSSGGAGRHARCSGATLVLDRRRRADHRAGGVERLHRHVRPGARYRDRRLKARPRAGAGRRQRAR